MRNSTYDCQRDEHVSARCGSFAAASAARAASRWYRPAAIRLRLGGSHAQRDVITVTLLEAARRRRGRRLRKAAA